jgi:glutathione S-transferase
VCIIVCILGYIYSSFFLECGIIYLIRIMESNPKRLKLIVGNKSYSSWSLRAWLAVRHAEGDRMRFDEVVCMLGGAGSDNAERRAALLGHSPTGKVPALLDSKYDVLVYDSLAICLHIAEQYPHSNLLPADPGARALCYSAAAEMHSGFEAIRKHCPHNCVALAPVYGAGAISRGDVRMEMIRIGELWSSLRQKYGIPFDNMVQVSDSTVFNFTSESPSNSDNRNWRYLFGHFTIADCMYAPIANRLMTYDPTLSSLNDFPIAKEYALRIYNSPMVQEWIAEARLEGPEWKIPQYEIADPY